MMTVECTSRCEFNRFQLLSLLFLSNKQYRHLENGNPLHLNYRTVQDIQRKREIANLIVKKKFNDYCLMQCLNLIQSSRFRHRIYKPIQPKNYRLVKVKCNIIYKTTVLAGRETFRISLEANHCIDKAVGGENIWEDVVGES